MDEASYSYIARLELPDGINSRALADSTYFEHSPEFNELKECGVQSTSDADGKEVIEAGHRLAKFNPNQWLMNAKDLEAIEWTPLKSLNFLMLFHLPNIFKGILKPVETPHDDYGPCAICLSKFSKNPSLPVVQLPCKVCLKFAKEYKHF